MLNARVAMRRGERGWTATVLNVRREFKITVNLRRELGFAGNRKRNKQCRAGPARAAPAVARRGAGVSSCSRSATKRSVHSSLCPSGMAPSPAQKHPFSFVQPPLSCLDVFERVMKPCQHEEKPYFILFYLLSCKLTSGAAFKILDSTRTSFGYE